MVHHWAEKSRRLILQNDGLVSLRHVATAPDVTDRLAVGLWGAGGEIARATYATPDLVMGPAPAQRVLHALQRRVLRRHGGLITPAATERTADFIARYTDEAIGQGVRPFDVFELFYADERVRRWAYTIQRASRLTRESFSPFCTRPFLEMTYRSYSAGGRGAGGAGAGLRILGVSA
jgi:hypothetical protein